MKSTMSYLLRAMIIAVALVFLSWLLGIVLPGEQATEGGTGVMGRLGLPLLSAFLLAAPLVFPVCTSRLSGRALFGVVFLAVFGLTTVLTQVEAAVFLDMSASELLIGVVESTVTAAVLSGLAVALYARSGVKGAVVERGPNPPTTASWVRRWIGVSFAYLVLYIAAGLLILPVIQSWYETQRSLGANPAVVFPLQIVRGALFVAFLIPLLRSMRVARWQAALATGVMIPLVHGVAALVVPNPFMPDYVRHAHMIEIGWSNFVLGLLIGFLFWNPRAGGEESIQPSGTDA